MSDRDPMPPEARREASANAQALFDDPDPRFDEIKATFIASLMRRIAKIEARLDRMEGIPPRPLVLRVIEGGRL
jgi:hypothetical protein